VKKKAALCMLRLYRKHPDVIPVQDWAENISNLVDEYDLVLLKYFLDLFYPE
jgi:AP-2 complex subunit alpha